MQSLLAKIQLMFISPHYFSVKYIYHHVLGRAKPAIVQLSLSLREFGLHVSPDTLFNVIFGGGL